MPEYDYGIDFREKCPECGDIVARREIKHYGTCYKCKRQSLPLYDPYSSLSDPYSSSPTFKDKPPTPKEVNKWTGWECPRCHKINTPFIESCNCSV